MTDRLTYLFQKQLSRLNSKEEKQELLDLISKESNEPVAHELFERYWEEFDADRSKSENVFQPGQAEDLLTRIMRDHVRISIAPTKKIRLWKRLAVAVAVAFLIFGAAIFVFRAANTQTEQLAYEEDVKPGRMGATLTLANGRKIYLSDTIGGELSRESGVLISKDRNGKLVYKIIDQFQKAGVPKDLLNTLSTAGGETYSIVLPDGTTVWLNSASSLTYSPALLRSGKRTVDLRGEGYFEVAHDKRHPFIVNTKHQSIQVLGTQFNVNSYSDESEVATTLIEGSVQVSAGSKSFRLKPGQQSLNSGTSVRVEEVSTENIIDWKNGDFALNHIDFKTAMRKIARWYNMEVVYDKNVPDNMESGGWIARDKPLSAVLKSIEASGLVKFKIEGRKIYVMQ